MGIYTENKEHLINAFSGFALQVEYEKDHGKFVSSYKSAQSYVENQIACEKGMDEYYAYVRECEQSDKRLLKAIRTVKGKTFVKHLLEVIDRDQTMGSKMAIVREPIGEFVKEQYGRYIKGYWVVQYSVGTEGDSFQGTICIEIRTDRYLKVHFSI